MLNKILVIGCGSIGSRHARNAKKIGIENIILCDNDIQRAEKLGEELNSKLIYSDYKNAIEENKNLDAVIIATPSSLHIEPAIYCANNKINLLIEKPLSNNLNNVEELLETVKKNNIVGMIGHSYRFHEGFLAIKKHINEKIVGKIYHVNYTGGHYLPDWHPKQDYRTEYAGQKKLGGGVLLTSMSHAFDNVEWLFGNVQQICCWKEHLSQLEIDVEDSVFCLMKTANNIVVYCQFDFLQRECKNNMSIVGEQGNIKVDFMKHEIEVYDGKSYKNIKYEFDQNKRYVDELIYFTKLIEDKVKHHELDLYQGKRILNLLEFPNIIQLNGNSNKENSIAEK